MVYVARLSLGPRKTDYLDISHSKKKKKISQQSRLAPGVKIFQAMLDQGETVFC